MTHYPIARYRFTLMVESPLRQPDYAGSMLRGAFGSALRQIACMTRQADCPGCPLLRSCPFTTLFAPPPPPPRPGRQTLSQAPAAYVIEPPPWGARVLEAGDTLSFDMVLFGHALRQLPLIVYAWQRAAERGIGHGRARLHALTLLDPQHGPQTALHEHGELAAPPAPLTPPTTLPDSLTLHVLTPLRLQDNGRPLPGPALDEIRLLNALLRRLSTLAEVHMPDLSLPFQPERLKADCAHVHGERQLRWQNWTRYSSRQQQTMQLGGVLGHWRLHGLSADWRTLLWLGQWLHIGKNASFGLGGYQLRDAAAPATPSAP